MQRGDEMEAAVFVLLKVSVSFHTFIKWKLAQGLQRGDGNGSCFVLLKAHSSTSTL